jgi:predicted transcriptional regulator
LQNTQDEKVYVGALVPEEQRRQLAELARQDDRSVSSVIRAALTSYVRREAEEATSEEKLHAGVDDG